MNDARSFPCRSTVFNFKCLLRGSRTRIPAYRRSRGYTLIEVMIGATLTLILLGIMIRAFTFAGDAISKGRAVIELSNELRTASDTLRQDLQAATSSMLPWSSLGSDEGYFEYVEGPTRDYSFTDDGALPNTHLDALDGLSLTSFGDGDDVIAFTARNLDQPYQGIFNGAVIESKVAEITWWTRWDDSDASTTFSANESITLHRRALLVAPSLNDETTGHIPIDFAIAPYVTPTFTATTAAQRIWVFLQNNDVSVRYDTTSNVMIANSLVDLTKRENRFAHNPFTFPNVINRDFANPPTNLLSLERSVLSGERQGEDVILSNVSAFDVQIYDPQVVIRGAGMPDGSVAALLPSDWGYWLVDPSTNSIGTGGYVDLNYSLNHTATNFTDPNGPYESAATIYPVFAANSTPFSGLPTAKSRISFATAPPTYCTWSSHYERDGENQDVYTGNMVIDQGTNGLDDDGTFGVDDEAERETAPPYPYPVRGIKVTFRVRDSGSQQLRQTSIESSFIPE